MMVSNVLLILVVFLLICAGLFRLQKRHVSFGKRVLLALGVGIVFGLILQFVYGATSDIIKNSMDWINVVGSGFVSLLVMLVIPIVFFAILRAFTSSKFTQGFGKISGLVIGILVATVIIAGAAGITSAGIFHLGGMQLTQGDQETEAIKSITDRAGDVKDQTLPDMIRSMIPQNIFSDFTQSRATSVIAVVVFSVIVGVAFMGVRRKEPEQAEKFATGVESIFTVVMRIVTLVLRLTPYGIFALITIKAASDDIATFINLGLFIIASYLAIIFMFLVHMFLIRVAGFNPLIYIRKAMPPLVFGFSSRSSAGTLPITIETMKKNLGVSEGIADVAGAFSVPLAKMDVPGFIPQCSRSWLHQR